MKKYDVLPKELKEFVVVSAVLTSLSLLRALLSSAVYGVLHGFSALWIEHPGFDFYAFMARMHYVHTLVFFSMPGYPWYYAAPAAPLYRFFYLFCFNGSWKSGFFFLAAIVMITSGFAGVKLARSMAEKGVKLHWAFTFILVTAATSWPIYFSLQRGNLESVLWLGFALAIWAIANRRWTSAALILGVVGSVKFYPLICFALFLRDRRWKELLLGIFACVATTALSLLYISKDVLFALRGTVQGIHRFTQDYATVGWSHQSVCDHSSFELLKMVTTPFHWSDATMLRIYMPSAAVLMLALFFIKVIHLPIANQLLFLTTAGVCLPPASFDYTLENMYVPFAWLVLATLGSYEKPKIPQMILFGLFAVVFAPTTFLVIENIQFAGLLKGVALIGLLVVATTQPLDRKIWVGFAWCEDETLDPTDATLGSACIG